MDQLNFLDIMNEQKNLYICISLLSPLSPDVVRFGLTLCLWLNSRWMGETVVVVEFPWPAGSAKAKRRCSWWVWSCVPGESCHPGGDLYRHSRWRRLHTKPLFSKQLSSFHFPSLYISTQSSRAPSCPPPFGSPWAQLVNPRALRSVQAQPSENTPSLLLRWKYDDKISQILTGSLIKLCFSNKR